MSTTTILNIEAAAKKLAACMDYPWEHMPEQGRNNMRKHAQAVIDAAGPSQATAEQQPAAVGVPDERDVMLAEARMVIASILDECEHDLPLELSWMAERASKGRRIYVDDRALAAAPVPVQQVEQKPHVMGRVYDGKAELNSIGRALPDHAALYAETQPAPSPAAKLVGVPVELLELLREIELHCKGAFMPSEQMIEDWGNCIGAALLATDTAQQQETKA